MESKKEKQEKVMTVREVSAYLKIPVSTIYELTRRGKLRAIKVGRQWRFLEEDISNYLRGVKSHPQHEFADSRMHPRIKTEIPARLTGLLSTTCNLEKDGMIHNLSEGGAFFIPQDPNMETGNPVKVSFILPGFNPSEMVVMEGRVVHQCDNSKSGAGIKFRHSSEKTREIIREYVG